MIYNFYDTCSLLMLHDEDFQNIDSNVIVISSITLKEQKKKSGSGCQSIRQAMTLNF